MSLQCSHWVIHRKLQQYCSLTGRRPSGRTSWMCWYNASCSSWCIASTFSAKERVCPDVYRAAGVNQHCPLARVPSPRVQQYRTWTCFLDGNWVNRWAGGLGAGHVPMSSTSPSLCSPSSNNSSFALIKFERRSLFSSLSSEIFRSLIDSNKYDCPSQIDSQQDDANPWSSLANVPGIPQNRPELP